MLEMFEWSFNVLFYRIQTISSVHIYTKVLNIFWLKQNVQQNITLHIEKIPCKLKDAEFSSDTIFFFFKEKTVNKNIFHRNCFQFLSLWFRKETKKKTRFKLKINSAAYGREGTKKSARKIVKQWVNRLTHHPVSKAA